MSFQNIIEQGVVFRWYELSEFRHLVCSTVDLGNGFDVRRISQFMDYLFAYVAASFS